MKADEFLSIARSKISNDPRSRLSPLAKTAIDNPKCVIDIHAHIFDKKCLTVAYNLLRLLESKLLENLGLEFLEDDSLMKKSENEIYEEIKNNKSSSEGDWQELENELDTVIELSEEVELFGYKLKEAFRVLKKQSMIEVFDYYYDNFSIHKIPEFSKSPLITGILMMDLETGWDIKPKKNLFQQIEEIKQLTTQRPIIPFLPVDPRRASQVNPKEDLYELFLTAFTDPVNPLFGVKCYPSLGYLPSDERLDPIFKICAEKNIPVLTHCGGEVVSTFEKKIPVENSSGRFEFTIPGSSRVERARFLNDPAHWESVLNKYNNLKLNFGHFGGDDNWADHNIATKNQRISKIVEMMKNPDWRVFADFSYNVVKESLFTNFKNELDNNPEIGNKVMFGTDYWVVLPAGDLLDMQQRFLTQLQGHKMNLLNTAPLNYLLD